MSVETCSPIFLASVAVRGSHGGRAPPTSSLMTREGAVPASISPTKARSSRPWLRAIVRRMIVRSCVRFTPFCRTTCFSNPSDGSRNDRVAAGPMTMRSPASAISVAR
jgi:hypothetical protein